MTEHSTLECYITFITFCTSFETTEPEVEDSERAFTPYESFGCSGFIRNVIWLVSPTKMLDKLHILVGLKQIILCIRYF